MTTIFAVHQPDRRPNATAVATLFADLARHVPIPYPWDLREYVRRVGGFRGRPITLRAVEARSLAGAGCGTGSGLWIARRADDVILYGTDTTPWHAEHIICHEIGHMLLAHDRPDSDDTEVAWHELMPSLSPRTILDVLRREDYASPRERDAETFADLVMVQASLRPSRGSRFHSTFFPGRHP